jgi:UDP-3-O-[3-hydroxymyristoyl] N-acetylglucosamine deacetylase
VNARPRRTLAAPTEILTGIGLHSGAAVAVQVLPAAAGTGIVFQEFGTRQEIRACVGNVIDTSRCTILGMAGVSVQTVEHLLSALAGLGVDDARVESRGGELPAGDGSAAPYVQMIRQAGIRDSPDSSRVEPLGLKKPAVVYGEGGASIIALPASSFRATVVLDYPDYPWIGTQMVEWEAGDYANEVAPARTYGFLTEIAWLKAQGLALGASYENGIALREDGYDSVLRFADELARHKLLDLIGDLSLIERPLAAHVIALKPSHTLNCRLAGLLVNELV